MGTGTGIVEINDAGKSKMKLKKKIIKRLFDDE